MLGCKTLFSPLVRMFNSATKNTPNTADSGCYIVPRSDNHLQICVMRYAPQWSSLVQLPCEKFYRNPACSSPSLNIRRNELRCVYASESSRAMRSTPLCSLTLTSRSSVSTSLVPAGSSASTTRGDNDGSTNPSLLQSRATKLTEQLLKNRTSGCLAPTGFLFPTCSCLQISNQLQGKKLQRRICENPGTIFVFSFFFPLFFFFLTLQIWCS